ncbi:MAG: hypothetical protein ACRC62_01405 [Microcoleus sp.]
MMQIDVPQLAKLDRYDELVDITYATEKILPALDTISVTSESSRCW